MFNWFPNASKGNQEGPKGDGWAQYLSSWIFSMRVKVVTVLEVIKEVVAHCQMAKGIRKAHLGMSLLDIIMINSALSRGFIAS